MNELQKAKLKRALDDIADVQIELCKASPDRGLGRGDEPWRYLYRIRIQLSEFIERGWFIS